MDPNKTALERAFEIASTGARSMEDIRKQLKAEGYNESQLEGRTLTSQLNDLIRKASVNATRS